MESAERVIGYTFADKSLLQRALTLSSYDNSFNNQTLEFFGDAILEFIVTEKLFKIDLGEGELTERRQAIVSDRALSLVSERLGLGKYLIKDSGDTNNKKAIPSVYEAIVAAVYLDGGMDAAKDFVLRTLDFSFTGSERNYKGELQELCQINGGAPPTYDTRESDNRKFVSRVFVRGKMYEGTGFKKREAEQDAARAATEDLKRLC